LRNEESLEKALIKIISLFNEQDIDKITIQREYLSEIFSKDLYQISKNDGFPYLKPLVLEYLLRKGIKVKSSTHSVQFRRYDIKVNFLRLKDDQIKKFENSLNLKDEQIRRLETSLSIKDKTAENLEKTILLQEELIRTLESELAKVSSELERIKISKKKL
jgi:hypothetical protein